MGRFVKILALHPSDWAHGRYAGAHGCEVRHVSIGGPAPTRLDGSVAFDGIGERVTRDGIEDLLRVAREFRPDVILFGIHFGLTKATLQVAAKAAGGARLVMHYTDQRDGIPKEVEQYSGAIDLLLLTNTDADDHAKYEGAGFNTATFYDGISPTEYHPTHAPPQWQAVFAGNNFAGLVRQLRKRRMDVPPGIDFPGGEFREQFLQAVVDAGVRLSIRGRYGWDRFAARPQHLVNVGSPAYHPNYLSVLHSGAVVLNTYNVPLPGLLTRRLWRSVASGRLYLTQYVPGLEQHFVDGVHLAWFKTIEEGVDKLRWYLDHEDERKQVARQGAELVHTRHTWRHRLVEFKDLITREWLV